MKKEVRCRMRKIFGEKKSKLTNKKLTKSKVHNIEFNVSEMFVNVPLFSLQLRIR